MKRLDKTTFPDGKFETYTYYADGLLKTKTDRMGQTLTYAYDDFKRLKTKTYPNASTIAYTYVGQKLTQVDDTYASPAETHTFLYDSSYRVQQNGQSTRGTLTYTYTPDDRVDTMTIAGTPNVTTAHTYYADGSLNTIVWSPQSGQFKYAYTPRGQYQTVTFPNGQTRSYNYDDQGRLTQLANALGATNIATYAYGYDVDWATSQNTMLGQRVSMTANVPSQGFTNALTKYSYDPLYQLKKAEYPNVSPFNAEVDSWTYDAIGNRLTSQVNASIQTYTYEKITPNPKNAQKLLGDGVNTYGYDFNGSQTSRTCYGFVNDPDNRLASITGAESATYTYDYQGRRTSKTVSGVTTKYLYDSLNLVSETTAGATTRYAFGPSIDEPLAVYTAGAVSYLNADGLGSIVATNSTTGTVSHGSVFDAWGAAKSETGTRIHSFTYTGREAGEAGLSFYRARLLDSARGRFSGEDPLSRLRLFPSLYAYGDNSPTAATDALGLWSRSVHEGLLHNAFDARLSFQEVFVLLEANADIDLPWRDPQAQDAQQQYKHAMSSELYGPEKAERYWRAFICRQLSAAQNTDRNGGRLQAMYELGLGLHAIADSFAPGHHGFQLWPKTTIRSLPEQGKHLLTDELGVLAGGDRYYLAWTAMVKYYEAFEFGKSFCLCP